MKVLIGAESGKYGIFLTCWREIFVALHKKLLSREAFTSPNQHERVFTSQWSESKDKLYDGNQFW